MFISQRGSRERDEGRGQEQEKRRRSGTGCDSFGPSAHQIVWWAKNAHGSESVWELSSDKGGSYACYSPIKPVSHTRAGGEEKGRAKDFHTKGNKQVHLLATNQSGGFCANINKKKREKNKQVRDLLHGLRSVEKNGTHAYNTDTWAHTQTHGMGKEGKDEIIWTEVPSRAADLTLLQEPTCTCCCRNTLMTSTLADQMCEQIYSAHAKCFMQQSFSI